MLSKGTYGNVNNAEFQNRLQNLQPTDLATLAFTSGMTQRLVHLTVTCRGFALMPHTTRTAHAHMIGTTGQAKCVMLSHRNLMFSACAIGRLLAIKESDSLMSFLPFAHVAEQLLAVYVPVVARCRIYFGESTAKLHRNMREIQPSLVFAPPELWRKIYLAIQVRASTQHSLTHPSTRLAPLTLITFLAFIRDTCNRARYRRRRPR